jgi:hypothetical protein
MAFHVLVLLLAQSPSAERLRVDWLAPEGCPDGSSLRATLESTVPRNKTFSASVRIDDPREAGKPWRAVITTRSPEGPRTRVVEASDCARVTEAAVLVVTLAATNIGAADTMESENRSSTTSADAGVTAPDPDLPSLSDDSRPKKASSPFFFSIRLQPEVGASVGVFPLPGVSLGLAASFTRGPVRLELAVAQWLNSQTAETRRGARFSLTSVRVKGCWLFSPNETTRVGPCVSSEGGPLSAEGTGIAATQSGRALWLAALGGVTIGFLNSQYVHPWFTLEAGVNIVRPLFLIVTPQGVSSPHDMGWPVGRLTVGVEILIP